MAVMQIKSLQDLFLHELKDLYDAENQLVEVLPQMEAGSSADELKAAFNLHLYQTREHVMRLEHIFKALEQQPTRINCKAMEGLIKEAKDMLKEDADPVVKDAGIIAAAQRFEHYEMAGYGTVRTFAYVLGHQNIAQWLQLTLDEEEQTDKHLTQLANTINLEAMKP